MEYNCSVDPNTCDRKLLKFWWPGYEMQLLRELQKQQNSAQFCDTLLETEGISVPTHSCVLAAFSPYLSQKLSESPSPPCGQKRQLRLRAVTAQTLLKLVGLLYSGELEVKGGEEQNDVMAAAHQFGITGLVAGRGELLHRGVGTMREIQKGEEREKLQMQDAQVQAEMTEERGAAHLETKISVSIGTQTVKTGEMPVGCSGSPHRTALPVPENVSSVRKVSAPLQPQKVPQDKAFSLSPCPAVPSNGDSTAGQLPESAANPASSSASFPVVASKDSSSPGSRGQNVCQQTGDFFNAASNGSQDQPDERLASGGAGGERALSEERRHLNVRAGIKSLAKMLQMETTQISFKVKLKRRKKGEKWEVVTLQDANEALSVHNSLNEGRSSQEVPDRTDVQPPAETQDSQAPKTANHSSSSLDPSSSGSVTLNRSSDVESSCPFQIQCSVEEADEQIERWLEDMFGLNILSNLDGNCEKSELNRDEAFSQETMRESGTGQSSAHAGVGAGGCPYYLGAQTGSSSSDTGMHLSFGPSSQPACTSCSSLPPGVLLQQRSPFFSSLRSTARNAGTSYRNLPQSKSENPLCVERASAEPVRSFRSSLNEQKLHDSALQQPPPPKDQALLEFAPSSHGSKAQSEHTLHASLPCIDDFSLPPHLSPLEAYTGEAQDELVSNLSANPGNNIQEQKSLLRRPWLPETHVSLQFPLKALIGGESAAPPQDATSMCKTFEECCAVNSVSNKERVTTADLASDPKISKESLGCKQCDKRKRNAAAAPKRKRRRSRYFPQDDDNLTVAYKKSKVRGRRKTCVVSLSSKNVLMRERVPSNKMSTNVEKTQQASRITGSERELTRCPGTERTRIRTRGFVRSQEKMGNKSHEVSHVLLPVVHKAAAVNQGGSLLKRKRGRPRKIKLEERLSGVEGSSHNEANEHADKDLSKGEKGEAKIEDRKREFNATAGEGVPLKKTRSAEGDDNNNMKSLGTSRQSCMVTLKEFQKLIQRQQSKTCKPKETQATSDAAGGVGEWENAKGFRDSAMEAGIVTDVKDNAKSQDEGLLPAVDENKHQVFNTTAVQCSKAQPDDSNSSAAEETRALQHPEASRLSTQELLKNPHEGECCGLSLERVQSTSKDEDESLSNSHLLQVSESLAAVPTAAPPIPEKLDPLVPGGDGIQLVSEHSQEKEEEEVDVLFLSPGKNPWTKEYEDGLNSIIFSPDEEDEEEMNEIDVTGDETE